MKRIINTLLLLSVAIIAMAQTSFVVADKNGNSQLVQSLVFQQQQTADRFSWKSDGSATGDINDLLFIARAKNQLSTANTEDVTKMLEELSGTDLADAEAIATALKTNPNVEEAYTADGANLIVTTKDEGYHVVYPMYDANYVFVNDEIAASLSKRLNGIKRKQPRKAAGTNGKIAIFNFYDGFDSWYKTQNAIIKAIEKMFEDHDYYVEKYGDGSNGLLFTEGNLKDVVRRSSEYKAIIIMGHGGARWTDVNDYNNQYPDVAKKKRHVIATKQQCYFGTGGNPNNEYVFREEADDKYYYMMDCELEVTGDCILYDGTCCSAPTSGYSTESDVYPNVSQSVVLGWNGFNRMSQAHAALLFYLMLYERFDLKDAITLTFQQDPSYGSFYLVKDSYDEEADRYDRDNSKLFYSKYVGKQKLQGKSSLQKQFTQNASITLDSPGDKTVQDTGNDKMRVSGKLWGNLGDKPNLTIELHPIYGYGTKTVYTAASKPLGADYYMFSVSVPLVSEGIYDIIIRTLDNSSSQSEIIMLKAPQAVIYSGYFRKNCALPVIDDEDSRTPIIYNEKDETVAEITIPAGTSQTYHIDAYPGHAFETPCLDKSVCDVSVSGNTLTVKGLKEGSTIFGVFDVQNRQMAVAEVTVTASSGTETPGEAVDLGLPSGLKWANMNVGATSPEDYGDYFAWGEVTPQSSNRYYWDSYKWCNGSSTTLTKYCNNSSYGNDGFTDTKTVLDAEDDAAHANWGGDWRMPTLADFQELIDNTTSEWTTQNGVKGRKFTSNTNGKSIFLPAAGCRWNGELYYTGSYGFYWSSTLDGSDPTYARSLLFDSGSVYTYGTYGRDYGRSVRPVRK